MNGASHFIGNEYSNRPITSGMSEIAGAPEPEPLSVRMHRDITLRERAERAADRIDVKALSKIAADLGLRLVDAEGKPVQ